MLAVCIADAQMTFSLVKGGRYDFLIHKLFVIPLFITDS